MINDFQLIKQSRLQQRWSEAGKVPAADDWRQTKADAFLFSTGQLLLGNLKLFNHALHVLVKLKAGTGNLQLMMRAITHEKSRSKAFFKSFDGHGYGWLTDIEICCDLGKIFGSNQIMIII